MTVVRLCGAIAVPLWAVGPAFAAAPTYVGTWGADARQCALPQESDDAPMIMSAQGYDRHETHCTFRSVRGVGPAWNVVADCSVQGDTQTDVFDLEVTGDTLALARSTRARNSIRCK